MLRCDELPAAQVPMWGICTFAFAGLAGYSVQHVRRRAAREAQRGVQVQWWQVFEIHVYVEDHTSSLQKKMGEDNAPRRNLQDAQHVQMPPHANARVLGEAATAWAPSEDMLRQLTPDGVRAASGHAGQIHKPVCLPKCITNQGECQVDHVERVRQWTELPGHPPRGYCVRPGSTDLAPYCDFFPLERLQPAVGTLWHPLPRALRPLSLCARGPLSGLAL